MFGQVITVTCTYRNSQFVWFSVEFNLPKCLNRYALFVLCFGGPYGRYSGLATCRETAVHQLCSCLSSRFHADLAAFRSKPFACKCTLLSGTSLTSSGQHAECEILCSRSRDQVTFLSAVNVTRTLYYCLHQITKACSQATRTKARSQRIFGRRKQ